MSKPLRTGNEYRLVNDDDTTTSVKEAISYLSLSLFEDIVEMNKKDFDIQTKIELKCMALNAIANADKIIH